MRLGIKMLDSTSTLNNLVFLNQVQFEPGETAVVYFQLTDLDKQQGNCVAQRYMPADGATMSIQITSIDATKTITKIPTNPFANDKSIWSFNLTATDTQNAAGVNMKVTLTEGASIKIAKGTSVIVVGPQSEFSC